jgi:hypothetical protein
MIGPVRLELPVPSVDRPIQAFIADGGPALLPAHGALEARRAYQTLDRAPGHPNALACELPPDLACPIDLEVLLVHPLDCLQELDVALQPRRLRLPRLVLVLGRWGDRPRGRESARPHRQPGGRRRTPHPFARRSSSAWAKKAAALRRISLARFSSRFSRSNSLSRSRSEPAGPPPCPESCSVQRTHLRNVSAVQPILPAIEQIAAHCDSDSPWCSRTRCIARS